ncbi:hypothetical protein HQ533_02650 [Candidatus Woesearchaeota archaeon]|nr:hypothetical protein [Candidatus Woesearchaeota archaeon]
MAFLGALKKGLGTLKSKASNSKLLNNKVVNKVKDWRENSKERKASGGYDTNGVYRAKSPGRFSRGMKFFGNAISKIRDKETDPYYGSWKQSSDPTGIGKFLIFMWILHIIDWSMGFPSVTKGSFFLMPDNITIGIYFIATIVAIAGIFKAALKLSGKLILISLLAIMAPRYIEFALDYPVWVHATLCFIPVWGLYLMFGQYSTESTRNFGTWYLIVVVILGFYGAVSSELLDVQGGLQQANVGESWRTIKETFGDNTKEIVKDILMLPGKIELKINQSLSTNYFTGQVERNKDAPLGVYLEDLRATEEEFTGGYPIVVWANIRGKSFEGAITVNNRCYARKGSHSIFGKVHPTELFLYFDDSRTLECIFEENLDQFEEGTYSVTFESKFAFPTWGYIAYTFVDKDTQIAYYTQKKNINQELDIPNTAEAIYTSGPAAIGMNSLDMPIIVYPDNPYILTFGMTLMDAWSQGKVEKIQTLEIRVPKEIMFDRCYPLNFEEPVQRVDEYDIYEFDPDGLVGSFKTITCPMKLRDPANFLGTNLKLTKTFAVEVEYDYSLTKSTNIRIKKY